MLFLSCGKTRRGRKKKTFLKQICCQSQSTGVTRCSEAGPVNACKTQSARPDCNYAGTNMLFKMSHYELMLHCQSPVCFCPTVLDSLQKVWLMFGRRGMTGGLSEQVDAAHRWEELYTDAPVKTERSPSLQIQVLFSESIYLFSESINHFCCLCTQPFRCSELSCEASWFLALQVVLSARDLTSVSRGCKFEPRGDVGWAYQVRWSI